MNRTRLNWLTLTAVGLVACAGGYAVAHAGQPEAQACAARLAPEGQMMFRAVAEHVKPDSDIPSLMREYVRPLVVSGRIRRDDAQHNAPSVGKCLLLLK